MTYKELQAKLKELKLQGKTDIKLNSSKEDLEIEYSRLMASNETVEDLGIVEILEVTEVIKANVSLTERKQIKVSDCYSNKEEFEIDYYHVRKIVIVDDNYYQNLVNNLEIEHDFLKDIYKQYEIPKDDYHRLAVIVINGKTASMILIDPLGKNNPFLCGFVDNESYIIDCLDKYRFYPKEIDKLKRMIVTSIDAKDIEIKKNNLIKANLNNFINYLFDLKAKKIVENFGADYCFNNFDDNGYYSQQAKEDNNLYHYYAYCSVFNTFKSHITSLYPYPLLSFK